MNKTIVDKKLIKKKSRIDNKFINAFLAISIIIPLVALGIILMFIQEIFLIIYSLSFMLLFVIICCLIKRSNNKKAKQLDNNEVIITKEQITNKYIWKSHEGPDENDISKGTSYYLETANHKRLSISNKDYEVAIENDYAYIIYTRSGKFLYAFPCNTYELDNELRYIMERQ